MSEPQMTVGNSSRSFVLKISGFIIASISTKVFEQEHAARTIAARYNTQPELLAALEKWERYGTDNGGEENYSFLAETRAAIAKAGER